MGRRRKSLLDNMFDRVDDVNKDLRKAGRRTFRSKKRKKGGSARKWAKRTNREIEALTEQMALLVRHLSAQTADGRREGASAAK